MPPKERTAEQKNMERQKILDAALDIIVKEGYNNLSMRKIASEIGSSATKIYSYFHSKEEVYLSVVIEGFHALCKIMEEVAVKCSSPEERLTGYLRAFISFSIENRNFYEVLFETKAPKHKQFVGTPMESIAKQKYDIGTKLFSMGEQALQEYVDKNHIHTSYDAKTLSFIVFGYLHGVISFYHNRLTEELFDRPEQTLDDGVKLILEALHYKVANELHH